MTNMQKETVLVTGGSGYVAGWCIVMLLEQGYTVRTTVRSLAKKEAIIEKIAKQVDRCDRLHFCVADLANDMGWNEAVQGCDYVLHVASPLGGGDIKEAELIEAAKGGAIRVLRAATEAGVQRVVMTSSCAAATPTVSTEEDPLVDESFWTDPNGKGVNAYRKSKTLSEEAAWQFMKDTSSTTTLTTILPGAIFGPVLSDDNAGSVEVIMRFLNGKAPGSPRIGLEVVDVRDVAALHIKAMCSREAAGERYIAVSGHLWMGEVAGILHEKYGATRKVPTRKIPDFVLRLLSIFDPSLKAITPMLGRKHRHTSEKAIERLAWTPRAAAITVVECAESLIEHKMV